MILMIEYLILKVYHIFEYNNLVISFVNIDEVFGLFNGKNCLVSLFDFDISILLFRFFFLEM